MRFADAFRETVFRFQLKGVTIAAASGLTTTQVSRFRNGDNLRIDSVEKILSAMPPEARAYMLDLVKSGDIQSVPLPNSTLETED